MTKYALILILSLSIECLAMELLTKEDEYDSPTDIQQERGMEDEEHKTMRSRLGSDQNQEINIIVGDELAEKTIYRPYLMLSVMLQNMSDDVGIPQDEVLDLREVPLSSTEWDDFAYLLELAYYGKISEAEEYIYHLGIARGIAFLQSISFLNVEALLQPALNAFAHHIKDNYNNAYNKAIEMLPHELQVLIASKLLPIRLSPTRIINDTTTLNSITWSPRGRYIASASSDKTIHVWDRISEKQVYALEGNLQTIESIAWSPDGTYIASGSFDKTVRIWNSKSKKQLHALQGHTFWVRSVAWSPNSRYIVSGSSDKTVRIWDALLGKQLSTLEGHTAPVLSVVWSPDGNYIASGSSDKTIRIWDFKSGKQLYVLQGDMDMVRAVAWSPNGKLIASASNDKIVYVWDAISGKLLHALQGHTKELRSVAWSSDSRYVASGAWDGTVRLWDIVLGKQLYILRVNVYKTVENENIINEVAWSSNGKYLAAIAGNTINVWEILPSYYTLAEAVVMLKMLRGQHLDTKLLVDDYEINEQEIYDMLDSDTKDWLANMQRDPSIGIKNS